MRTRGGMIGWGPRHAKEGDDLWIVPGCNLPVLFRPNGNVGQANHIGPCFVPGLMFGETAERLRTEKPDFGVADMQRIQLV
ncbi:hypothetical protein Micbo1qcDRAFT_165382 [Microdochium bolleyi]|uniref:Uncharacterized protein n=1 Tax=Microdochium bolleyi TaxID=196109 RepID=A0A136IWE0_9PEZI|nr:hypothetical protein Micbo1qcDRAFT_165382 [Microdochium bolleyi]